MSQTFLRYVAAAMIGPMASYGTGLSCKAVVRNQTERATGRSEAGRLGSPSSPVSRGTSVVNGTRTEHAYNSRNQVLSIIHKRIATNEIFSSFAYTRDLTGKITQAVEAGEIVGSVNPNRTVAYSYDPSARLVSEHITSADATTHNIDYVLDAVGNRLSKTETKTGDAPQVTTYSVNANDELTFEQRPDASLSYGYTPLGETAAIAASPGGTTAFTWGFDSRLVAAATPAATLAFRYDDTGIRHQRTENGAVTNFLVDRNWPFEQILEERNGVGTITAGYAFLDERLSLESGGLARFYHADSQRSTRGLTNGGSQVVASDAFDAFGVSIATAGDATNPFLYSGEQLDSSLGKYYLRARYLLPAAGRMTSRDPLQGAPSSPISLHFYVYANGEPVGNRDPSGLFTLLELVVVIGIILAAIGLGAGIAIIVVSLVNRSATLNVLETSKAVPSAETSMLSDAMSLISFPTDVLILYREVPLPAAVTYTSVWLATYNIKRFEDAERKKHDVVGKNIVVISSTQFLNRYRLAAVLFGEQQHLGGAGDSEPLQKALDDFIEEFILKHGLTGEVAESVRQTPPHGAQTSRFQKK